MDRPDLSAAIARIYDCAIDRESWHPALELLRDRLGAPCAALLQLACAPETPGRGPPQVTAIHTEWDAQWLRRLPAALAKIPRLHRLQVAPVDEPVILSDLIGPDVYHDSRFFAEWLAPQDLVDGCTTTILRRDLSGATVQAGVIQASEDRQGPEPPPLAPAQPARPDGTAMVQTTLVSVPIARGRDRPDAEAMAFLRLLAPHFRKALLISDVLDLHRERTRLMAEMLDTLSVPVLLVGRGARIEYANAAAELLLAEGRLSGAGGILRPTHPQDADAFAQALAWACAGEDGEGGAAEAGANGFVVAGRDGPPLVAHILPIGRTEMRAALGGGLAAIFVSTKVAAAPRAEVLTAICGLTLAEAEVALAIAEGTPLEAIAAARGTSIQTVRKQLSSIYEKTRLNSQAALGAFIHGLASPVIG